MNLLKMKASGCPLTEVYVILGEDYLYFGQE
jgi:hypothetical protein